MRYSELYEAIDIQKTADAFHDNLINRLRFDRTRPPLLPMPSTMVHSTSRIIDLDKRDRVIVSTAIKRIMEFDPTPNKKYTIWMIRRYIDRGIRQWEDFDRTRAALELFNQVKRQLPQNLRDINQFRDLVQLENVVEPFIQNTNNKTKEKDLVKNKEVEILLNTPKLKVVIPLTEEASCYYGRNTKWCTASTRSQNYFNDYNSRGPLYIILDKKENKRWQFFFPDSEFMTDQEERAKCFQLFKKHPEILKIKDFGEVFRFVGESLEIRKNDESVEYVDINEKLHMTDRPALFIERLNGNYYLEEWQIHGKPHKENGPFEIERRDGDLARLLQLAWAKNGKNLRWMSFWYENGSYMTRDVDLTVKNPYSTPDAQPKLFPAGKEGILEIFDKYKFDNW